MAGQLVNALFSHAAAVPHLPSTTSFPSLVPTGFVPSGAASSGFAINSANSTCASTRQPTVTVSVDSLNASPSCVAVTVTETVYLPDPTDSPASIISAAPTQSSYLADTVTASAIESVWSQFSSVLGPQGGSPSTPWAGFPTAAPPDLRPSPKPYGGVAGAAYSSPAWLPTGMNDTTPSLNQTEQNGGGYWGTLTAPHLPHHLNGSNSSLPWGSMTVNNTNPYISAPTTNVTRYYEFTISYKDISPDGVTKPGLVVNGQFPGPLIEANWGDMISVTVHNLLPNEGTSLHWHGILQTSSPWMDGVPSIQQCPIAPNQTMTYLFQADLYGTSWYHSHYSAQYAGGALGPMIIYGPASDDHDEDLGAVMLSDWFHDDYYTLVEKVMAGKAPSSNNNLINGKMNYPCQNTTSPCTANAGISKFQFTKGKRYRMRLINASAEGMQKFSLDGHTFKVIANDFVPIEPYTTDLITLGAGQRTDIVVTASGKSDGAYWMRSNLTSCSVTDGVSPLAVAAVYYEDADTYAVPKTSSNITDARSDYCGNDDLALTVPTYVMEANEPSVSQDIGIEFQWNGTNFVWTMDNVSFHGDYNDPILLEAKLGNTTFDTECNVYNFGSNSTVQIVFYNYFTFSSHPMHLHGHNFQVLAEGFGTWNGSVTRSSNPMRRDTQLVQPAQDSDTPAYIVVQFDQDNGGAWPFHCHIAWHVSAGLYITVLEQPDKIIDMPIPSSFAQTCRQWGSWTGVNIPDQIDSGL